MMIKHFTVDYTQLWDIDCDVVVTQELNKFDTLEFEYDGQLDISKYDHLLYKDDRGVWREYIVYEIDVTHDDNGIVTKVYSENSISELRTDAASDKIWTKATIEAASNELLTHTRWTLGTVDTSSKQISLSFYHKNAMECLSAILEGFNYELETEIRVSGNVVTDRILHLRKRIGSYRGRRFEYKYDLSSVSRRVETDDIITRLYPYGKGEEMYNSDGTPTGGYGRRISISDVNAGLPYITDIPALNAYGRLDKNGNRIHRTAYITFDDIEDHSVLLDTAKNYLADHNTPKISYEASVDDLKQYGFDFEGVGLGDDVVLIDDPLGIEIAGRVLKIVWKNDKTISLTLGSFRTDLSSIGKTLSGVGSKMADLATSLAQSIEVQSSESFIKYVFDNLDKMFSSSVSYFSFSPENGIIVSNNQDQSLSTSAVQIVSGGIRVANSKNPDGTWDFGAYIDGNGLAANSVQAFHLAADVLTAKMITVESGESLEETINNIKTTPGDSAYEIAVKNGFVGTEQEWIASLKGTDGSDGIHGKDGVDGKDGIGFQWNLLKDSYGEITQTRYDIHDYYLAEPIAHDEWVTAVIKGTLGSDRTSFKFYNSGSQLSVIDITPEYLVKDNIYKVSFQWKTHTSLVGTSNTFLRVYHMPSSGTSESTIEWVKLVRGTNTTLEWAPSQFDQEDMINNLDEETKKQIANLQASDKELGEAINLRINEAIIDTGFTEAMEKYEQALATYDNSLVDNNATQEQINKNLEVLQAAQSELEGAQSSFVSQLNSIEDLTSNIAQSFKVINGVPIIENPASKVSLQLLNDKMSFMYGGSEVAYYGADKMWISVAQFDTGFDIGRYQVRSNPNGSITMKWV